MKYQYKHWGKALAMGTLALFAYAFIIHVGWNMAMPDIFGLDQIRFKPALGLALLVAALTLPFSQRKRGNHEYRSSEVVEGKAA